MFARTWPVGRRMLPSMASNWAAWRSHCITLAVYWLPARTNPVRRSIVWHAIRLTERSPAWSVVTTAAVGRITLWRVGSSSATMPRAEHARSPLMAMSSDRSPSPPAGVCPGFGSFEFFVVPSMLKIAAPSCRSLTFTWSLPCRKKSGRLHCRTNVSCTASCFRRPSRRSKKWLRTPSTWEPKSSS